MKQLVLSAAMAALASTSAIAGLTYTYQGTPPPNANTGGYGNLITDWAATYDTDGILSLDVEIAGEDVNNDGFWFVVSQGPNPKGVPNELAILYGDIANDRVTTYIYNGANASSSWNNPGVLLQSDENVFTVTDNERYSFSIDVSALNSRTDLGPNWEGAQFFEKIGIWFHPFGVANITYDSMGDIMSFSANRTGYFDTANLDTVPGGPGGGTDVPAPGALALLGLGIAAIGARRRKAR